MNQFQTPAAVDSPTRHAFSDVLQTDFFLRVFLFKWPDHDEGPRRAIGEASAPLCTTAERVRGLDIVSALRELVQPRHQPISLVPCRCEGEAGARTTRGNGESKLLGRLQPLKSPYHAKAPNSAAVDFDHSRPDRNAAESFSALCHRKKLVEVRRYVGQLAFVSSSRVHV